MDYGQGIVTGHAMAGPQFKQQVMQPASPPPSDPASLRGQFQAFGMLCERLSVCRNNLRDIADTVLGGDPESPCGGAGNSVAGNIRSAGGVTADIVSMFENAAALINQIDQQIVRLQRVSS